jgi:hypothetical protein
VKFTRGDKIAAVVASAGSLGLAGVFLAAVPTVTTGGGVAGGVPGRPAATAAPPPASGRTSPTPRQTRVSSARRRPAAPVLVAQPGPGTPAPQPGTPRPTRPAPAPSRPAPQPTASPTLPVPSPTPTSSPPALLTVGCTTQVLFVSITLCQ